MRVDHSVRPYFKKNIAQDPEPGDNEEEEKKKKKESSVSGVEPSQNK